MQTQMEKRIRAHCRQKQRSGRPRHSHRQTDRGVDKSGTGIDTTDTDEDGETDPGIQQTQTEEQTTQPHPQSQR